LLRSINKSIDVALLESVAKHLKIVPCANSDTRGQKKKKRYPEPAIDGWIKMRLVRCDLFDPFSCRAHADNVAEAAEIPEKGTE
jgi:hypothetical protein